MKNEELNEFIKRYLEKGKSRSAIMLTGEWGIGKSHYIQNELIPFLKEDGKNRCVTVSLYGLKTLSEISKSIYLELRIKKLQAKGEAVVGGKLAVKTITKGVTSFFGIDLKASEEEMQELYKSIDLTGKLIILEDLERSQIDILELMGYVNNLVEQDGVKVLLVANEFEIIKYVEDNSENKKPADSPWPEIGNTKHISKMLATDSMEYLRIKEKTISDTIQFEGNLQTAILEIIKMFDQPLLNMFADEQSAKDIFDIMLLCNSSNLRSFIFACQKSADIFEYIQENCDYIFIQCIFFGIIFSPCA